DLAGVLHPAQVLDQRARRYKLATFEGGRVYALLGPRDAVILETEPCAGRHRTDQRFSLRGRGEPDLDLHVDTRGVELLLRTFDVAAVGHEERAVGGHEQRRRRAGEPGQVPDVRELGDEERVQLARIQPIAEPAQARRDV